jgi:hypothetical protein
MLLSMCMLYWTYMALLTEGEKRRARIYKHGPPDGGQNPRLTRPQELKAKKHHQVPLLITPRNDASESLF